jgi:hypothetical protein
MEFKKLWILRSQVWASLQGGKDITVTKTVSQRRVMLKWVLMSEQSRVISNQDVRSAETTPKGKMYRTMIFQELYNTV